MKSNLIIFFFSSFIFVYLVFCACAVVAGVSFRPDSANGTLLLSSVR
jgi:hypothetical protein